MIIYVNKAAGHDRRPQVDKSGNIRTLAQRNKTGEEDAPWLMS
jgi:hypothetical protein